MVARSRAVVRFGLSFRPLQFWKTVRVAPIAWAFSVIMCANAASDPATLPVGSVVQIESLPTRYNGIYTVLDTGPAIQGRLVDLYMWSCYEALAFGRKPIHLTVLRLGWSPRATAPGFFDRLFKHPESAAPLPSRPLPLDPGATN